jgi:hypothetical protein
VLDNFQEDVNFWCVVHLSGMWGRLTLGPSRIRRLGHILRIPRVNSCRRRSADLLFGRGFLGGK